MTTKNIDQLPAATSGVDADLVPLQQSGVTKKLSLLQLITYFLSVARTFVSTVTATGFIGPLTGNVTGNCTGSSGSCTGNAATADSATTAATVTDAAQPNITSLGGMGISVVSGRDVFASAILMSINPIINSRLTPAYTTSINIIASQGNDFEITATNNTAFTINNPSNGQTGQRISITIKNASGGALGLITWQGNYKMAAFTSPANGFNRSVEFRYDGTVWHELCHATSDVPN